jgi:hypothetical protein
MTPTAITRARRIVPVLLLLLGACHQDILKPEEVMNRIENSVQLPKDAAPLGTYDRYYAFAGPPGQIKGVYIGAAKQSAAGKRRWFDDRNKLPFVFDDGCQRITVLYYEPGSQFVSVTCSGAPRF